MKVICKSGLTGWRCKLQNNYSSFEDWEHYSRMYGLAAKLGYLSAADAWAMNPTIEGSTDPDDFRCSYPGMTKVF